GPSALAFVGADPIDAGANGPHVVGLERQGLGAALAIAAEIGGHADGAAVGVDRRRALLERSRRAPVRVDDLEGGDAWLLVGEEVADGRRRLGGADDAALAGDRRSAVALGRQRGGVATGQRRGDLAVAVVVAGRALGVGVDAPIEAVDAVAR